jgi:glycosyltransferase involved in cell wall biosynthesis
VHSNLFKQIIYLVSQSVIIKIIIGDAVTNDSPLVSIILPVFNGELFLHRCLESIYQQSYKNYELIIINDGSTDATKELLTKYHHKSIIIHQKNQGVSKSINKGLRIARGKYVCFIAYDDWWCLNKLEVELGYIQQNENIGVVYSDYYDVRENELSIVKVPDYDPAPLLRHENYINIGATLINKKYLDIVKQITGSYFDEGLTSCMDGDLWIRLSKVCDFRHIPVPLAYYFRHPNQISKSSKHISDRWRVYRRYNDFSLSLCIQNFTKPLLLWVLRIRFSPLYNVVRNSAIYTDIGSRLLRKKENIRR